MRTCETSSSVFQTIAASRRTGLPAGKVVFHSADGDEEFVEGDAYYVLPGHTPEIIAGTEVVEFSRPND